MITCNAGDTQLFGMDGKDSLIGRDGDDILNGGTGNDAVTGAMGDDLYYVNSVTDKVIEASIGGVDSVISTVRLTLASYVENLTLAGTTAISGTGNNMITGNTGANHLNG